MATVQFSGVKSRLLTAIEPLLEAPDSIGVRKMEQISDLIFEATEIDPETLEKCKELFALVSSDEKKEKCFPIVVKWITLLAQKKVPEELIKQLPWEKVHTTCLEQIIRAGVSRYVPKEIIHLRDQRLMIPISSVSSLSRYNVRLPSDTPPAYPAYDGVLHDSEVYLSQLEKDCQEQGLLERYRQLRAGTFIENVLTYYPAALSRLTAEELRNWDGQDYTALSAYPASLSPEEFGNLELGHFGLDGNVIEQRDPFRRSRRSVRIQAEIAAFRIGLAGEADYPFEWRLFNGSMQWRTFPMGMIRSGYDDEEGPSSATLPCNQILRRDFYLEVRTVASMALLLYGMPEMSFENFKYVLGAVSQEELQQLTPEARGTILRSRAVAAERFLNAVPLVPTRIPSELLACLSGRGRY